MAFLNTGMVYTSSVCLLLTSSYAEFLPWVIVLKVSTGLKSDKQLVVLVLVSTIRFTKRCAFWVDRVLGHIVGVIRREDKGLYV